MTVLWHSSTWPARALPCLMEVKTAGEAHPEGSGHSISRR